MPLLYWCKTELFYVTWRTPLWTQELSRLFLKYWNSSYVWNTTHNCSCFLVKNTIILLDLILWHSSSLELHLGEGGDLVQPNGLVEIVELLRPNQLLTGDQADQQGHCLRQGHWSSIHCFWSENNERLFFGWISILMKPKGSVNQRQTQKLHLLWNEITSPRLILMCNCEQ